jgi:group I intron endonuclease
LSVIYIIYCVNKPGKYYIGSAVDFSLRRNVHLNDLRHNKHSCKYLQRIFNECGESSFKFYVLEYVTRLSQLLNREDYFLQDWFDFDGELYNGNFVAGSSLGYEHSEKTKLKMRKRKLGKNHPFYGQHHTEETKRKMSIAAIQRCINTNIAKGMN